MQTQTLKQYTATHIYQVANQPADKIMGVGVVIFRQGKILLGKRKGAHGDGTWSVPGGKMEYGARLGGVPKWERPEEAAVREVLEETGLSVRRARIIAFHNHHFEEIGQTHTSIFVVAEVDPGEAALMEPHKCEKWDWFDLFSLPDPLFPPLKWLLRDSGFVF